MGRLKLLYAALIGVFITATAAVCDDGDSLPKPLAPYISDFANLIDPETEARMNVDLAELQEALDIQIAVVTIETIFDYGDWRQLDVFANRLFDDWGVGNPLRDDGILILISRSDRVMRIELGAAYGPVFQARMDDAIDRSFVPYFKGDEYATGIELGTQAVISRLQPDYGVRSPNPATAGSDVLAPVETTPSTAASNITEQSSSKLIWQMMERGWLYQWAQNIIGLMIFIGILFFLLLETRMRAALVGLKRCPNCGQRQLNRRRTIRYRATETTHGQDCIDTYCTNCEYHAQELHHIPPRPARDHRFSHSAFDVD